MKKRILSILLTLCMLFCLVPTGVFAEGETATGSAAIQLGTDALSKNVNTATAPTVYFGQDHENNPGAWRVIDYDGNSAAGIAGNMTLLAANNMGLSKFGASNAYADSALKEAIDALADKLTAKETDAVEKRTLASGNYDEENTDGVAGSAVSNAVFWPLSSKEANAVNNDLRVVDPEHPGWASSYWWLRSPDEDYSTAFVAGRGEVRYYGGYSTSKEFGVRPAFDLNLDSVLFASAAVGGKPDRSGRACQRRKLGEAAARHGCARRPLLVFHVFSSFLRRFRFFRARMARAVRQTVRPAALSAAAPALVSFQPSSHTRPPVDSSFASRALGWTGRLDRALVDFRPSPFAFMASATAW